MICCCCCYSQDSHGRQLCLIFQKLPSRAVSKLGNVLCQEINEQLTFGLDPRAVKTFLSGPADDEQQAALELAPKAQVLEGQSIYGHFGIQSLANAISRDLKTYFSTADAMLLRQNTRKTGNNAVKMSQTFHDTTWFERFTDLNLFNYALNVIHHHYSMVLFLLAVMVEGDESSWLRITNQPAVLAGYRPLMTVLRSSEPG